MYNAGGVFLCLCDMAIIIIVTKTVFTAQKKAHTYAVRSYRRNETEQDKTKLPCYCKGALLRQIEFLAISAMWLSGTTPVPPKAVIFAAAFVLR